MKKFGERLKAFRSHIVLEQKEFAKKIGAEQGSISHWENGRNKPDAMAVSRIAKAFPQLNIDWLMEGEGEMLQNNHKPEPEEEKGLSAWAKKEIAYLRELLKMKDELIAELRKK